MSRQNHDREDLLAEATALVERISLRVAGSNDEVLIGFRRDHAASIFFGQDRVFQFTSRGELRRAFVGQLFKAERGQLVSLRKERTEQAVEMRRHVLSPAETQEFLASMHADLQTLRQALASGNFAVLGQVPAEVDLLRRAKGWLDGFADRTQIASSPRAG
jgi:hypothetical protein